MKLVQSRKKYGVGMSTESHRGRPHMHEGLDVTRGHLYLILLRSCVLEYLKQQTTPNSFGEVLWTVSAR